MPNRFMPFVLLSLLVLLVTCKARNAISNPPDDIKIDNEDALTLKTLLSFDYKKYKGKKIGLLLKAINKPIYNIYIADEPPGKASCLRVYFTTNISIKIATGKYEYMNPYDELANWDLEKFKMEKLGKICIVYKDKCMNGCNEF